MTRRTRLAQLVVGLSAAAVFTASVSVAVVRVTRDEPATAAELLAEARRYVVEHKTVAFRGVSRQESTFAGFDEEGLVPPDEASTFVNRTVTTGVAIDPDRSQAVTRANGAVLETILIGDTAWSRYAQDRDELADELWIETPLTGAAEELPGDGPVGGSGGLGGFVMIASDESGAGGLTQLIDRTVAPTIESRTGAVTVIRAGLAPGPGSRSGITERHRGTVELTVADDGRPVRSVVEQSLELEGGDDEPGYRTETRLEQEYSAWGEPVDIEAPGPADIDQTPNVEEEAIADFTGAALYQPRGIPAGWVLDYADVFPAEDGDADCDQVEIDYIDPEDDTYGYLYLTQSASDCFVGDPPDDSVPFVAGPNRGWIESYDEDYAYAEIVVGDTTISADTDLSAESLAQVLSRLRPLDLTIEPEPLTGLTSSAGTPA